MTDRTPQPLTDEQLADAATESMQALVSEAAELIESHRAEIYGQDEVPFAEALS